MRPMIPSWRTACPAAGAFLATAAAALLVAGCSSHGDAVRGSGTIELDEVDVASQVGGRIVRLAVDEGDMVRAGDTLGILDRGEISAEALAQEAQAARAEAQSREVSRGARDEEIRQARAERDATAAQFELAEKDQTRFRDLFQKKVIAQAELDRATSNRDTAKARLDAANERLRLLEEGSRMDSGLESRVEWAFERMMLREIRARLVGVLSGGQRQRLGLACAMLHEPPVVFLDEPTAGVDPGARRLFWQIIRGLAAEGTAMIVTTHYMDEAERFDRLAFLSLGKLMAVGTPAEVKAAFGVTLSLEDIFVTLQERQQ